VHVIEQKLVSFSQWLNSWYKSSTIKFSRWVTFSQWLNSWYKSSTGGCYRKWFVAKSILHSYLLSFNQLGKMLGFVDIFL
jgi:hypothetical protein